MPELLPDFGVVLYLDGTFLVRKDPAELVKQDIPALAAVRDLDYDCAHRYAADSPDLQSGIPAARMLVLNLPALRRRWRPEQVESLVRDRRARFAGETLAALVPDWTPLPLEAALPFDRYGLLTKRVYGCAPHFVNDAYLAARKSPLLVDLSDWSLPLDVSADFADEFWKIARETPFYERLLVESVRGKPDRRDLRKLRRKARLAKWAPPFSYRRTVLATFLKDL